jgi:hypothetical protein
MHIHASSEAKRRKDLWARGEKKFRRYVRFREFHVLSGVALMKDGWNCDKHACTCAFNSRGILRNREDVEDCTIKLSRV